MDFHVKEWPRCECLANHEGLPRCGEWQHNQPLAKGVLGTSQCIGDEKRKAGGWVKRTVIFAVHPDTL